MGTQMSDYVVVEYDGDTLLGSVRTMYDAEHVHDQNGKCRKKRVGKFCNPYDDAIEEVHYRWEMFNTATREDNKAHHLVELNNAITNLITWHSEYEYRTGDLPWQREDAEQ